MKMTSRLFLATLTAVAAFGADASFQTSVKPILAKHCFSCHNEKLAMAGLNLSSVGETPGIWDKVRDKVATRRMPPPGQTPLAKSDLEAVTRWIDTLVKPGAGPVRVVARRLNRVEYNNTIRDLLGVPGHPADEFPVDDSGYGFDNIGDVLTVSPMLMEKYMTAAGRISKLAVYGESVPAKPTRLVRLLGRRSHDANDVVSAGSFATYLPFSLRGALYGSWNFPATAEYEFRLRIANFRPERKVHPPRKLVLTLDGKPIITDVVEGTASVGYSRGEFTSRVRVPAGEHALRASYPELADLDDPRQNINPDKRRGLFVDYLDIVGPFSPSGDPPPGYDHVFVCGHKPGSHNRECGRTIVSQLLPKAYRRPVFPEEIESKLRLVVLAQKEGDSFEEGIRLALEAVLVSPDFLFRSERTGDYALASRLSYFLWSSMPDEELLRAAASKTLHKPEVLEAQTRRMLADRKASNLVDNFAAQWLQLRNLGRTKPDVARFPTVDDELLDAMRRETSLFVEAVIREDRSVLDFLDAPFTFVNGPLARHYGMKGIDGEEFRRVPLDGEQRGGLLTQGAILTVSSYPTRTSPPVRGKWVLENLLGAAPPPPPPNVPVLDESKLGANVSLRERLEQHRKDPSCSPCHNQMDPIGFGLESYDAVGAWRTHDGQAKIDTSGTLPDGKSFQGAKDLKQILRSQSDAFTHNLTEKLMTFALGRGLEATDRPAVDQIVRRAAANNYKFSTLVLEIVNSQAFETGSGAGGKS